MGIRHEDIIFITEDGAENMTRWSGSPPTGHKIPVSLHVDHPYAEELDRALSRSPDTVFVWAHMGDSPRAKLVADMMERRPNLYADLSCRHRYYQRPDPPEEQSLADERGVLKPEWKELLERFPDRFMVGTDMNPARDFARRFAQLDDVVRFYRSILGQLRPETAERIGSRNAKAVLGM